MSAAVKTSIAKKAKSKRLPGQLPADEAGIVRMLTSAKTPGSAILTITPSLATKLLKYNVKNRGLRPGKVALWASFMEDGRWVLNGESISFAPDLLLNGQHRLEGCVAAGVSFTAVVVWGLDPAVQITFDTGTRRSFGDALTTSGQASNALLTSTISWCYRYESSKLGTNVKDGKNVAFDLMLDYLDNNVGIIEVARKVNNSGWPAKQGITRTHVAGLMYEAKGLEDVVEEFITAYTTKIGLYKGHPALTLLNWVEKHRSSQARPTGATCNLALVKAFNAFARGEDLHAIVVKKRTKVDGSESERYGEEFPTVITAADL